jgi:hypothetical protein
VKAIVADKDPEFVLKLALYVREKMYIRTTANYLLALAANLQHCHPFLVPYFLVTIKLPSDMIEESYPLLFSLSFLEKLMIITFAQRFLFEFCIGICKSVERGLIVRRWCLCTARYPTSTCLESRSPLCFAKPSPPSSQTLTCTSSVGTACICEFFRYLTSLPGKYKNVGEEAKKEKQRARKKKKRENEKLLRQQEKEKERQKKEAEGEYVPSARGSGGRGRGKGEGGRPPVPAPPPSCLATSTAAANVTSTAAESVEEGMLLSFRRLFFIISIQLISV